MIKNLPRKTAAARADHRPHRAERALPSLGTGPESRLGRPSRSMTKVTQQELRSYPSHGSTDEPHQCAPAAPAPSAGSYRPGPRHGGVTRGFRGV
jgi:hypothetical protein